MPETTPARAYDPDALGRRFPSAFALAGEADMIRFARAIGETNPVYLDPAAARAAGHPGLIAPPTYVFVMKYKAMSPVHALEALGIEGEAGKLLHAEQSFDFVRPIVAGDAVRFDEHVADITEKKGGALVFVTIETAVIDTLNEHRIATVRHTEVVRREG